MNNADYGLSLQKLICEYFDIKINSWAKAQFDSSYNKIYEDELLTIIPNLFKKLESKPIQLLTYSQDFIKGHQTISPHNFILEDGRTLSIRTFKASDKVAPRTVGQAGFAILNDYFSDIYGNEIKTKNDVKNLVFYNIHDILPVFIENLFQSDVTVFLFKNNKSKIQIIKANELADYSFQRSEFSFTRDLESWVESTTLKYHGKSIAEIQTHKERSFKFRFIISAIPEWFKTINETNESLGISAEAAICDYFKIQKPESFRRRIVPIYIHKLAPVVEEVFNYLPKVKAHTGSLSGVRGEQSKCSYDFILEGNITLSLKTNRGKMVCPPEVGQPGSKTCLLYFRDFFDENINEVTRDDFKKMVMKNIDKLIPIYIDHLFESEWLLWIYEERDNFKYKAINKKEIKEFCWNKSYFTFTKESIEEWNESNTVKYCGKSLGEFQIHQNRNSFKFRFNMQNLLDLLIK